MMKMRKEIDLKEYNTLKDDMDYQIKTLKENKVKLVLEEQSQENEKNNFNAFKEKINNIVFSDDEKILELAQTIFDEIKVESIKNDETKHKVILHAKLNVLNSENETFDLEKFLLLFCTRQRCCFDGSRICRKRC